jgi:predicted acetyltransferase
MPRLIVPDVRARESFLAAMAEFAAEHRTADRSTVGSDLERYGERWGTEGGFARFVADVLADEQVPRRAGLVTQSTRWWVDGPDQAPEFVGRIAIRHRLTEQLRLLGGHIGYDVRPSRRRQGHATAMLAAGLELAHHMGIDPALITCDTTNLASRRVIESNGGVLADQSGGTLRFWVPTRSVGQV